MSLGYTTCLKNDSHLQYFHHLYRKQVVNNYKINNISILMFNEHIKISRYNRCKAAQQEKTIYYLF